MAVRDVIRMGHPTLRQVAKPFPLEKIGTQDFLDLIVDMRDTLHAYNGIGLAAPQIDESIQVAVIEMGETPSRYGDIPAMPFRVYINPAYRLFLAD